MARKPTSLGRRARSAGAKGVLPADVVRRAWEMYFDFGINIVTARDRRGRCRTCRIAYDLEKQGVYAFLLCRRGRSVTARALGRTGMWIVSEAQRRRLLRLFDRIDRTGPAAGLPPRGPHQLVVCA
jgi:hypothetical protein